jgi:excisionase family DNA binding protein
MDRASDAVAGAMGPTARARAAARPAAARATMIHLSAHAHRLCAERAEQAGASMRAHAARLLAEQRRAPVPLHVPRFPRGRGTGAFTLSLTPDVAAWGRHEAAAERAGDDPPGVWLSEGEVAHLLGVDASTVSHLLRRGVLQTASRRGRGRRPLIAAADVEAYLAHRREEAQRRAARGSDGWMTSDAAAAVLGVARSHISHLIRDGTLTPRYAPSRGRLTEVSRSEVEAYAAHHARRRRAARPPAVGVGDDVDIVARRARRGWSVYAFALRSGVHAGTIRDIEAGRTVRPSARVLEALERALAAGEGTDGRDGGATDAPASTGARGAHSPERLAGLHAHTAAQRERTVARLREAIARLRAEGRPVSAQEVFRVSGLSYAVIRRNVEALALFTAASDALRRRTDPTPVLAPRPAERPPPAEAVAVEVTATTSGATRTEAPAAAAFAGHLRALRLAVGLTIKEAARVSGVDDSFLSKLERAVASPPLPQTVARLAVALGDEGGVLPALADAARRERLRGRVGPVESALEGSASGFSAFADAAARGVGTRGVGARPCPY